MSASLLLLALAASAQQPSPAPADSLQQPDSAGQAGYYPFTERYNGLRLGFNVGRMVAAGFQPSFKVFEAAADYAYGRHFLAAELGYTSFSRGFDSHGIKQDGAFLRLGLERNLLRHDNDALFAGFRYGFSTQQDAYERILIQDPYWGNDFRPGPITSPTFSSHWLEVVGGMKMAVLPQLWVGFTVRAQQKLRFGIPERFQPEKIVGFGNADADRSLAFEYYVYYRWTTGKAPELPKKEK